MNITKIIAPFFAGRAKTIEKYATHSEEMQQKVLMNLVSRAKNTEWGKKYGYSNIKTYEDFRNNVPVQTYEEVKPYVERMMQGETNILWSGTCKWYAKSSGTTSDKSKFIPVTKDALHNIHYKGGKDAVASYLAINPNSNFFSGKGLILGGSHSPNLNIKNSIVGDLSAILIENVNPFVEYLRVPSKEVALMNEWEEKIKRIVDGTISANVTNLSGVPSWMLVVIKNVMERKGVTSLEQVWPNLEVFFHGGVAFTPYREQYKQIILSDKMHYVETYNASEGYFGTQTDLSDPAMMLMIDYDVFYEFVPMEEVGKEKPKAYCLEEVEINKNYAMLISTSSGLWRYMIGDTVKFTSKKPYKFVITGRTKHFINAFGEEIIIDNAEKGLAKACKETGAQVNEYTAAPVFMDTEGKGRHQWLIEFSIMPNDISKFAKVLDETLQEVNSDYEAKRHKSIALEQLELIVARPDLFQDWMAKRGKLGGQNKVPRLSNNREHIEDLLQMN